MYKVVRSTKRGRSSPSIEAGLLLAFANKLDNNVLPLCMFTRAQPDSVRAWARFAGSKREAEARGVVSYWYTQPSLDFYALPSRKQ